jgi:hypothetical protein
MTDRDNHILNLARDYLDYCLLSDNPLLDRDERATVAAQRSLTHDQLIAALGPDYDRPFDMRGWARRLISTGGGSSYTSASPAMS